MAKFIVVPDAITLKDTVTDVPLPLDQSPSWPWGRSWRMACTAAAMKNTHDVLTLVDLRRKADEKNVGDVIELTDDEFKIIEPEFRRPDPRFFPLPWAFSAEDHQRAMADAKSKPPPPKEPAP